MAATSWPATGIGKVRKMNGLSFSSGIGVRGHRATMGSDSGRRTALAGANLGWHTPGGARRCPARTAKSPARSPLVVQGGAPKARG
ncbi:hypothetical protein G6F68_016758 [Rhizopus microsporus]|nr:hypothetical protein G6F68_016758 [Rhizopus microsporus]